MWFHKMYFLSPRRICFVKFYEDVLFGKQSHTSSALSAGHSKWANIRHTKALKDGRKSELFEKISRQIRLAIREGGSPDPSLNSILRNVIDAALRKNMPKATIQNFINMSNQSKALLKKHFIYLRYKQNMCVLCILVYTDNFAHLKMELAPILKKSGAVNINGQHMFDDVGIIEAILSDEIKSKVKSSSELEDVCTEDAIECGAENIEVMKDTSGTVNFICNRIRLDEISSALKAKGYVIKGFEHVFVPKYKVRLSNEELFKYQTFLNKLRNVPGVAEIYDNLEENPD